MKQRPDLLNLILITLATALSMQPGVCSSVVSPPLPDIGNRSVVVSVPAGYVVQNLDIKNWKRHTRSGGFSIVQKKPKRIINIEVLNDNLGRYRENGFLLGAKFTTDSGLDGLLRVNHIDSLGTEWDLVIPVTKWNGVGYVRLFTPPGATDGGKFIAKDILRRIRFVSAGTKPGFHSD